MIELRRIDRTIVLSMNAPRANALSEDMLAALGQGIATAVTDGASALVITGTGASFSAGLALPDLIELDRAAIHGMAGAFSSAMRQILACPLPTIAAINGHAIAGGCVIALMCDARLMVRDGAKGAPKIGLTEVQVGIGLPAIVLEMVRAKVPASAQVALALEGRLFTADTAAAAGVIDEAVDGSELEARALARAATLATGSPMAYAQIKRSLMRGALEAIDRHDAEDTEAWLDSWFSDEGQRRLRAAVAKITKR